MKLKSAKSGQGTGQKHTRGIFRPLFYLFYFSLTSALDRCQTNAQSCGNLTGETAVEEAHNGDENHRANDTGKEETDDVVRFNAD
jgi:hypothetical protein